MNFSCAMSFKIVQSQNSYYDAVPMCGFGFFFMLWHMCIISDLQC